MLEIYFLSSQHYRSILQGASCEGTGYGYIAAFIGNASMPRHNSTLEKTMIFNFR